MTYEYKELVLVKVEKPYYKTVEYFAVNEYTAENMEDASSAAEYIIGKDAEDYASMQFNVTNMGKILVQCEND